MNAVGKIQLRDTRNSLENKGYQRSFVFPGQIGVDGFEFLAIFLSHIGWNFHPRNDNASGRKFGFRPINDDLQVLPSALGRETAQAVIAAK